MLAFEEVTHGRRAGARIADGDLGDGFDLLLGASQRMAEMGKLVRSIADLAKLARDVGFIEALQCGNDLTMEAVKKDAAKDQECRDDEGAKHAEEYEARRARS